MSDPSDPRFDLERQIQSWRQTISAELAGPGPGAAAPSPEVLDELESHLRDDVEQLVRAGRPPAQAWQAAVARLGEPPALAAEFRKSARPAWLPARAATIVLAACALLAAALLASRVVAGRTGVLLAGHQFTVVVGYLAAVAVGMTAVAAAAARSLGHFGPARSDAFRRTGARLAWLSVGMTLLGVVLGAAWAGGHLGRAWGWDPRETGGLGVLAWSAVLLSCLRWRAVSPTSAVLAGVVANVVVAAAWFGPPLIEARAGSYGVGAWHAPLLAAFVASQLACLYACLLPAGWLNDLRTGRGAA
jgi:hypothetical protein